MLLDVVEVPVYLSGSRYATLQFTGENAQAVTLKIFLVDGEWSPEMAQLTYTEQ